MDAKLELALATTAGPDVTLDRSPGETRGLLDINATAERLGVSPRFVRRLIAERRIPYIKVGKYVRIDPAELEAWILDRRVAPAVDHATSRAKTKRARSDLSIS